MDVIYSFLLLFISRSEFPVQEHRISFSERLFFPSSSFFLSKTLKAYVFISSRWSTDHFRLPILVLLAFLLFSVVRAVNYQISNLWFFFCYVCSKFISKTFWLKKKKGIKVWKGLRPGSSMVSLCSALWNLSAEFLSFGSGIFVLHLSLPWP